MYKYAGAVWRSMEDTPCEGERKKGASPTDGASGPLNTDVNWTGPPFFLKQAVGVSPCGG